MPRAAQRLAELQRKLDERYQIWLALHEQGEQG